MDLNVDINNIKAQIQGVLGKFSKSPTNSEAQDSTTEKKKADAKKLLQPLTNFLAKYTYEKEKILGVDLTPHYVRVCQMENSYDKWSLINLASSCMENQFRKDDIASYSDLYVENLRDLIQKNEIKIKKVAFSIPTSSSVVKIVRVPEMDEEDFHQAAAMGTIWEGMVTLDAPISEYSVYYKVLRHNEAEEIEEQPVVEEPIVDMQSIEQPEAEVETEQEDANNPATMAEAQGAPDSNAQIISEEIPVQENLAPEENQIVEQPPAQQEVVAEQPVQEVPQETMPVQESVMGDDAVAQQEISSDAVAEQPIEENPEIPQDAQQEQPIVDENTEMVQEQPITESQPEQTMGEAPIAPVEQGAEEIPQENIEAIDPNLAQSEQAAESALVQPDAAAIQENAEISTEQVAEVPLDAPVDMGLDPSFQAEIPMDNTMDFAIEQPQQLSGPTMDVLFIAAKTYDINLHAGIIRRAGLEPVLADVSCLALKHAFETNPRNFDEVREPYAYAEFGPDENYVFVVDGYNTDIYNIYVSDDDKNNIIYNAANVDLVNQFAQNYSSQLVQILDQHKSTYKTQTINHVFVSSSAPLHVDDASVEPLIKMFVREASKNLTGRKVAECSFLKHISVPEQFAKKVNAEGDISAWASTVGIASRRYDIFGYEGMDGHNYINMSNLLPGCEDNKKAERISILSTVGVAGFLAVTLLGILLSYGAMTSKSGALADEVKSMVEVEPKYQTKMIESQKLSLVMSQVNSLDDIRDSLPSNQSSIISAYKHITTVIPEGVWLQEVNYIVPKGIEINGRAINDKSILDFVNKLNEGKEFEKIALKTMEIEEKKGVLPNPLVGSGNIKNFTLEGKIKDNVSMKGLEFLTGGAK